jgi:hypothetical protein
MPKYNSKTQSKNGGRRRKQTKRKMRRGRKSRKVMRGGDRIDVLTKYDLPPFASQSQIDARDAEYGGALKRDLNKPENQ